MKKLTQSLWILIALTSFPLGAAEDKLAPDLREAIATEESVDVIVVHRHQVLEQIVAQVRPQHDSRLDRLRSRVRDIFRARYPVTESVDRATEKILLESREPLPESDRIVVRGLLTELESAQRVMRQRIFERVQAATASDWTEIAASIAQVGGKNGEPVTLINALPATLPSWAVESIARHPDVVAVELDRAAEPELNSSVPSVMKTSSRSWAPFWKNGFDGGIWDLGLCDTGVDSSHVALSGHRFFGNGVCPGGNGCASPHGTHVAGIVGSTDNTNRGVAWGVDSIVAMMCQDNNQSKAMSAFNWMLHNSPDDADVGNLSMRFGTISPFYDDSSFSRYFDSLVYSLDFMVTKSAGNGGNGGKLPTMTYPANSYNILAVGNMDDKGTTRRNDDRIDPTSSQGPTALGRRKPDLVAPGTVVFSTVFNNRFDWGTGSSMAAPHVAGALLLMMDAGVSKPRTAKAVLLNTADAWTSRGAFNGSRWDKVYGWGYLDLWEAEFNLHDTFENTLTGFGGYNSVDVFEGVMYEGEKATLVWDRPAYFNFTYPFSYSSLNNLNLYLYDKATGALIDSSTSIHDNVEQVAMPYAYSGRTVLVRVYPGYFGSTLQSYSLATEENFRRVQ